MQDIFQMVRLTYQLLLHDQVDQLRQHDQMLMLMHVM